MACNDCRPKPRAERLGIAAAQDGGYLVQDHSGREGSYAPILFAGSLQEALDYIGDAFDPSRIELRSAEAFHASLRELGKRI